MRKVAVVTIHGIGAQSGDFADSFHKRLIASTKGADVACFPAFWASDVQPAEEKLFNKLEGVGYPLSRKFFITFGADAIAYQTSDDVDGAYSHIHQSIDSALSAAMDWMGENGKLILVAHSLGTIIASNFIWDVQHPNSSGNLLHRASDKARSAIERLGGLFTLGSPIAVWSLRYDGGGKPISVPWWMNVYSPYDVVGYPLSAINDYYRESIYIMDKKLCVGGLLTRYTHVSHITYFDDKKVVNLVKDQILWAANH